MEYNAKQFVSFAKKIQFMRFATKPFFHIKIFYAKRITQSTMSR